MTAPADPAVRRVRADDWEQARALRLQALRDPDAGIAFLDTYEHAAAQSDEFWMGRTASAASGAAAAQFAAIAGGRWVGTLTVLVRPAGTSDHLGRRVVTRRADVVGVYVDPGHRGDGTIDRLIETAADWARGIGATSLWLDVHAGNLRAQAAYRRAGFVPTGQAISGPIGPELMMTRQLR